MVTTAIDKTSDTANATGLSLPNLSDKGKNSDKRSTSNAAYRLPLTNVLLRNPNAYINTPVAGT